MTYVIKAVLNSTEQLECSDFTAYFPIPDKEYGETIRRLEEAQTGNSLTQDCLVSSVDSFYGVLDSLTGTMVNVDELDYLAKQLDSFDDGEAEQFQAMACKLGLTDIKDLINLTFCCQRATVISDFSKLKEAGEAHRMNLNGGTLPIEELQTLDARGELPKYKALLSATGRMGIHDMMSLTETIDEYTFKPTLQSPMGIAVDTLKEALGERASDLLSYVNLHNYGCVLMEQRHSVLTAYGMIERKDGQPIQAMEEQPQQGGLEMM